MNDLSTLMVGNRVIKIWSRTSGLLIKKLDGHPEAILDLDWDENFLASASRDQTINLWDRKSGSLIRTLLGHEKAVYQVRLGDPIIASSSKDTTIKIWDYRDGSCKETWKGHKGEVRCLAFKNNILLSGSDDSTLKVWDIDTGKIVRSVSLNDYINSLQFEETEAVIASGKKIHQIDIRIGNIVRTMRKNIKNKNFSSYIRQIQFDDNKIIGALGNGKLCVIDWTTGQCVNYFTVCLHQRVCFAFDHTNTLITGDSSKTIKIWDFSMSSDSPTIKEQTSETKVRIQKQCDLM
jgi:WD40 repeat protein